LIKNKFSEIKISDSSMFDKYEIIINRNYISYEIDHK